MCLDPASSALKTVLPSDEFAAATGDDGKATFDVSEAGPMVVFVQAAGRADFVDTFVPSNTPVRAVLRPGIRISGRVGPSFDSAARLRVGLAPPGRGAQPSPYISSVSTCDADGAFELAGAIAELSSVRVLNGLDVLAESIVRGPVLKIEVRPRMRLAGRVVDESGRPIPNAEISARQVLCLASGFVRTVRRASTGDDGLFHLESLAPDAARTELVFTAEGRGPVVWGDMSPLTGDAPADVLVPKSGEVRGVVTDKAGSPVAGAILNLSGDVIVRTDKTGRFSFPSAVGQARTFRVSADGYLPATGRAAAGDARAPVTIALEATGMVKAILRVGGENGAGLARLTLRGASAIRGYETSADGSASWRGVEPGIYDRAEVSITGSGRASVGSITVSPGAPWDLGTVMLDPGAIVRGSVRASDGRPLSDVLVRALEARKTETILDMEYGLVPEARTKEGGRFEISDLSPGSTSLYFSAPGFATTRLDVDASLEGTDLDVVTLGPGSRLAGGIRQGDAPASGWTVKLRPGGFDGLPAERSTVTDDEGRFLFEGVAPGQQALVASRGGKQRRRIVRMGEADTEIRWSIVESSLDGSVSLDGEPVNGAHVVFAGDSSGVTPVLKRSSDDADGPLAERLVGDPAELAMAETDREGSFLLTGLGSGPGSVRVAFPDGSVMQNRVEIREGTNTLHLDPGRKTRSVRSLSETGQLVAGVRIVLEARGGSGQGAAGDTDSDGLLVVRGLEDVRFSVTATYPDGRTGRAVSLSGDVVDVRPGSPDTALRVRAADDERRPVIGATVVVLRADGSALQRGRTGADGVARLTGLTDVARQVMVFSGKAFGVAAVDGAEGDVVVTLGPAASVVVKVDRDVAPRDEANVRLGLRILDPDGVDWAKRLRAFGLDLDLEPGGAPRTYPLPAGRYQLVLTGARDPVESRQVRAEKGRAVPVLFR